MGVPRGPGVITAVSFRFLYLIFDRPLDWLICSAAHRRPKTSSCTSCATRSRYSRRTNPQAPSGLGRPRTTRRPHPAATDNAAGPPPGHPGHDPALAPPSRTEDMALPEPVRPPTDRRHHRRARRSDGEGQPDLELPPDPGRTAQARPPRRRFDDPPDSQTPQDPASAVAAHRHQLAPVPAPTPPRRWP
jgi:hypothetical protein